MKKQMYDLIVPLGANCGASMWLRSLELQHASYPFDWVTGVNFQTKADLLLRDCKGYCELDDLEFLVKKSGDYNDSHCDYYKSKKHGVSFYHDFPAGVPLTTSYPAVSHKYARRITRLYEDIRRAERVLVFWFTRIEQTTDETVVKFQRELTRKFGKEIDLLTVEHDPSKENTDRVEKTEPAPHVVRYKMDTNTPAEATYQVYGNARLIEPILRHYGRNRSLTQRICSAVKGPLVRLASLAVLDKAKRKTFRRKYFPEYQYRKNLREIHKALRKK